MARKLRGRRTGEHRTADRMIQNSLFLSLEAASASSERTMVPVLERRQLPNAK